MIYNKFKQLLVGGTPFDFLTDTIKVALMAATYTPLVTDVFFGDIMGDEIVAGGYTAGGVALVNKLVTQGDDLVFTADDITLNIATGAQVKSLVIYREVSSDPNVSELIRVKDFTFVRTVVGNTFKIEWSDNGIILLR